MAKILGQKSLVVVASGLTAIVLETRCQNKESRIDIPDPIKSNSNVGSDADISTNLKLHIVAGDISFSERYLVLCTSNKQLILWEIFKSSPLSTRISSRIASKVKFVPSEGAIILADKSGDAYVFSVTSPYQEGKLLLGHLSMLLDVLVTPDERFIITCDRDEKIRVSCYPNAYNIHSFCLGHKEFVTGIFILPHDVTVLVSSSGDGSIRFWNYQAGVEVYKIESSMDLSPYVDINEDDEGNIVPITLATSCNMDTFSSVICCCLSKIQSCFVYQISGNSKNITHKLIQTIRLQVEPWDILCINKHLWIIGPRDREFLCVFDWDTNTRKFKTSGEEGILSVVTSINSKEGLFRNAFPATVLTLLYKRRYDNVQEYQNRKRQRLASCTSTLKSTHEAVD